MSLKPFEFKIKRSLNKQGIVLKTNDYEINYTSVKQNKTKTDLRTSGRKKTKQTSDYVSMIVMLKFKADLPYQS